METYIYMKCLTDPLNVLYINFLLRQGVQELSVNNPIFINPNIIILSSKDFLKLQEAI